MKKKLVALIIALITFSSCQIIKQQQPCFYVPVIQDYYIYDNSVLPTEYSEGTDNQVEICSRIYDDLSSYYHVSKAFPTIRSMSREQVDELLGSVNSGAFLALYDANALYLLSDANLDDVYFAVIAHELMHYIADTGDLHGFVYYINESPILFLDEGIATYFSAQRFPYDDIFSTLYEYETHVAHLLSIIYGEDRLLHDYLDNNIDNIRDDFNKAVKYVYKNIEDDNIVYTPFDIMAKTLDAYSFHFYEGNDAEAYIYARSIEEMLLFYGKTKGLEEEVKTAIKQFELETPRHNYEFNLILDG